MRACLKISARAFAGVLLIALSVAAYDQPLSSESIRDAYFLGRRMDQATGEFLSRYVRTFPIPKKGPHIAQVQVLTPYAQIVQRAQYDMVNDSVISAEADYRLHAHHFLVRVTIYGTPTFPYSWLPEAEHSWREFSIRIAQGRPLTPQKTVRTPIYSGISDDGSSLIGASIELEFDAAQVTSAPMTIEVSSPDGQHVQATFELDKLK